MAGVIRAMTPRAVFFNADRLFDISAEVPAEPLINTDVYWHEAANPVASARLLGTFQVGYDIPFTLPLSKDTDVALRAMGRGARGLTTVADIKQAEPILMNVKGLGSGSDTAPMPLENQHVDVLPVRSMLNSQLPFLFFGDDPANAKSDIMSRRTPTGAWNVITDFNASGDGRIYYCTITAGSTTVTIIPNSWFDADVTWHPLPYWSERAVPHSFRVSQGVRILGGLGGGVDLYTTVTAIAGATLTLAAAPAISGSPGALVHDDTAAINAAFQNRGHIWIPEGRYWINQALLWPATSTGLNKQIILEGDGEWRSVLMFNHDGNGIQLNGPLQTGDPNSGVYDSILRNLGIWCVPDNNKEGIRDTNKGHGLAFTATNRSSSGVPGPSTGNVRVENVTLQGWGRWGLWSDNLQTTFLTNVKGYHNGSGAIALVGNATIRGTSQQEDNAIEITNSVINYGRPTTDSARTLSGGSINTSAPRSLTISGGDLTQNDIGRIIKLIDGPGVGGSTHVTMIESVQSATQCTISMPVYQSASGFSCLIYQTSVANIFLHNANNVRINGGTHQGNWVGYNGDTGGIRAENLDCLRIDGLWEEDSGGTAGAAIDLYNTRAVDIDSTHTGGSVETNLSLPGIGHGVGIRMTDVQGVKVRGCYLGQTGAGTAYQTHGNCQGVHFENTYGADWVAGLANTDIAGEPAIIGHGCHSLSFDNVQTNTVQLWDERWSNILVNPNFLDGTTGWNIPTPAYVTQPGFPYANLKKRWERYLTINSQAAGSGLTDVLTQDVPVEDSRQSGQWTFSWDHYIESRGAGGSTDNQTVVTIEVRTATSGYTSRSVTLTADAGYGLPTGRWMRITVKTTLDGGVTGRFFRVKFSNAGTGNSPIFRVANLRLQPGIAPTFDADQPLTQEKGGNLYAPLVFTPIADTTTQFPPPASGSPLQTIVNQGGVLKIGSNGSYLPIGTSSVSIAGMPFRFPTFNAGGNGLTDGPMKWETNVHLLNIGLLFDPQQPMIGSYTGFIPRPQLAVIDSTNEVFFGADIDTTGGTSQGVNTTIRAGKGDAGAIHITPKVATGSSLFTLNAPRSNTIAQTSTLYVGINNPTDGMDGVVVQPTAGGLYLGSPFSYFKNAAANPSFRVDQLGNIATIKDVNYSWPSGPPAYPASGNMKILGYRNASGTLALEWLDPPSGGPSGGYITIANQGAPLTQRTLLNFIGPGVIAADQLSPAQTNVTILTASGGNVGAISFPASQEGTVSVAAQSFSGHKYFNNGVHALDSSSNVPLVAQWLTSGVNGSIQEWWSISPWPLATLDTQATLRLGRPYTTSTGFKGVLELCDDSGSGTFKLQAGFNPTAQVVSWPRFTPSTNQALVSLSSGSTVTLGWASVPTGSGIAGQIAKWDPTGATIGTTVVNGLATSSIVEQANGTTNMTCAQLLVKQSVTGNDWMDFWWRTGGPPSGYTNAGQPYSSLWRYDHRGAETGGPPTNLNDAANTQGEMQLIFDPASVYGPLYIAIQIGNVHTWINEGLILRPPSSFPDANILQVYGAGTTTPVLFAVGTNGNLSVINTATYTWPNAHAPAAGYVLKSADGSGGLQWSSSSGGIGGGGSANYVARFTPDGVTLGNSSFQDDGTTITALNRIIGSGEGNINFGDMSGHRIGGLYCINGVFIETIGTTRSSPHSFGFYPQYTSPTGDESGQIFLYSTRNLLQAGNQIRTTLGSFYGIEIRGTRGQTSGVTPSTGSSSDPSVSIFAETTNVSVLQLKAISGTTANLLEMLNGGSTVARVDGSGNAYFNQVSVPGSGSTTATLTSSALTLGAPGPNSAILDVTRLVLQNQPDSVIFKPGHVGTSTGVIFAEVNGSTPSTKQIPFGKGTNAGDYFTWSTSALTWVISPAPSGSGGANTALSNLTATAINQSFVFNADGVYNIGDPTNRVGAIYLKNAFFVYTTGSSISTNSPHSAGFLDPASGECSRLLIAGNQSVAQGGFGQRTTFTAYYGLELRGSRVNGSAPAFSVGSTSDPNVTILNERDVPALRLDSTGVAFSASTNIFEVNNQGSNKFVIRGDGSVVELGGHQFAGRVVNAAYTLTPTDCLLICDISGGTSYQVTLPSAYQNGIIYYIVRENYGGGSGASVKVQALSGEVFNGSVSDGSTTGNVTLTGALQKLMIIAWQARWYSFAV